MSKHGISEWLNGLINWDNKKQAGDIDIKCPCGNTMKSHSVYDEVICPKCHKSTKVKKDEADIGEKELADKDLEKELEAKKQAGELKSKDELVDNSFSGRMPRPKTKPVGDIAEKKKAVTAPGFEPVVKELKKNKKVDNPWALSWWMKGKGYRPKKKAGFSTQNITKEEFLELLQKGNYEVTSASTEDMFVNPTKYVNEMAEFEISDHEPPRLFASSTDRHSFIEFESLTIGSMKEDNKKKLAKDLSKRFPTKMGKKTEMTKTLCDKKENKVADVFEKRQKERASEIQRELGLLQDKIKKLQVGDPEIEKLEKEQDELNNEFEGIMDDQFDRRHGLDLEESSNNLEGIKKDIQINKENKVASWLKDIVKVAAPKKPEERKLPVTRVEEVVEPGDIWQGKKTKFLSQKAVDVAENAKAGMEKTLDKLLSVQEKIKDKKTELKDIKAKIDAEVENLQGQAREIAMKISNDLGTADVEFNEALTTVKRISGAFVGKVEKTEKDIAYLHYKDLQPDIEKNLEELYADKAKTIEIANAQCDAIIEDYERSVAKGVQEITTKIINLYTFKEVDNPKIKPVEKTAGILDKFKSLISSITGWVAGLKGLEKTIDSI